MKKILNVILVVAVLLSLATAALAQEDTPRPELGDRADLLLDSPITTSVDRDYFFRTDRTTAPLVPTASNIYYLPAILSYNAGTAYVPDEPVDGPTRVIVRLSEAPVGEVYAEDMQAEGAVLDQASTVLAQQSAFIADAEALVGAISTSAVQRVLNAVFLQVDAADIPALRAMDGVISVNLVRDYELDLSETVAYIGATDLWDDGFTGEGVTVAVIDSGVDYTHAALGGSGDPQDYDDNDPAIIEPGTFPTAKVIGGWDFVGADWPNGDLAPDPDPLDKPAYGDGHGTHVSDIIGGVDGVAPDVGLYVFKVCSSVASSCEGEALMLAMERAADPNQDWNLLDRVDIINMSLGSFYGQAYDDDLSKAVNIISLIGTLTVTSSGNSADKPFITGTPGAAAAALSTAQTNVPSAIQPLMEVTAPEGITGLYAAVWQDWSTPLGEAYPTGVEASLQYGDGEGGNLNGCSLGDDPNSTDPADAPFPPGSLTGKIVLVDRGVCNFSIKIYNIQIGGGLVGIIGLVAPGEPFNGAYGAGGPYTIPGYMINLADSNALKSGLPDTVVKFDPGLGIPLQQIMVGSSSRGPSYWKNYIKPEIGAPGASVSAVAGSGTDTSPFGGTSGAAPMVAGSAALLREKLGYMGPLYPFTPYILKSMLVTTGETDILNEPVFFGGDLAAITRIGGGEVRVDRAAEAKIAVWEAGLRGLRMPTLSYGSLDVSDIGLTKIVKVVDVYNLTNEEQTYQLSYNFRFENDELNEAVQLSILPETLVVPPSADGNPMAPAANFAVTMTIDGAKLRQWGLNSGSQGANGDALTTFEYDGYLWLDDTSTTDDDASPQHMPWMVLPRLAGDVVAPSDNVLINGVFSGIPAGTVDLTNEGVGPGYVDGYAWLAHSPEITDGGGMGDENPIIDIKDVGVMTFPVPAGYCSGDASFVMVLTANTYDRYAHGITPGEINFDLDIDQDGTVDYTVYNGPFGGNFGDGRVLAYAYNWATGTQVAYFYAEHNMLTGNYALTFCGEQIGLNADDFFDPIDMEVWARDNYYGNWTDAVLGIEISPLGERYVPFGNDIASGATETWVVLDYGPSGTNPGELGVLLFNIAARSGGVSSGSPADNETTPLWAIYP